MKCDTLKMLQVFFFFSSSVFLFFFNVLQLFLKGHILLRGCKNMFRARFPPVHINVCDLFYTSTSGVAGSELPAPTYLHEW